MASDVAHERPKAQPDSKKAAEVLRAATRVFREKGYHAATVGDIAAEVGMLKGSLYYYISKKEDLLHQILDFAITVLRDRLIDIMASTPEPRERVRLAVQSHVLTALEFRDEVAVFLRERHVLDQARHYDYFAKTSDYERLFRRCIDEGIRSGAFAETDTSLAMLTILGMCNGVLTWFDPKGRLSAEEIASAYGVWAVDGILRTPVQTSP